MKRIIYFILSSIIDSHRSACPEPPLPSEPSQHCERTSFRRRNAYSNTQVFVWPIGSVHTVQFPFSLDQSGAVLPYQSQLSDNIRFAFGGWVASNSSFVGTTIPSVDAGCRSEPDLVHRHRERNRFDHHRLRRHTPNPNCGALRTALRLQVRSPELFMWAEPASAIRSRSSCPRVPLALQAFPYPGWVFTAWDISGNYVSSTIASWNVTAPITITPEFTIAKRVNFLTNPLGLRVQVDGAPINTPVDGPATRSEWKLIPDYSDSPPERLPDSRRCAPASSISLPARPTSSERRLRSRTICREPGFQRLRQRAGTESHVRRAPMNTGVADTITGNFVVGIHVTLYTIPAGFKIMVDGTDNLPGYTFIWGVGQPTRWPRSRRRPIPRAVCGASPTGPTVEQWRTRLPLAPPTG